MVDEVPSTLLLELDKVLSGEGTLRRGELAIVVAGPPATIKTASWRHQIERAMEDGKTAVCFDFDLSDVGAKPPDDPITP